MGVLRQDVAKMFILSQFAFEIADVERVRLPGDGRGLFRTDIASLPIEISSESRKARLFRVAAVRPCKPMCSFTIRVCAVKMRGAKKRLERVWR